ncbi:hypothetical protein M0Q50_03295 [bacterium]|jgi:hypothetical protein|nr:hypothetical protein [bacterium]
MKNWKPINENGYFTDTYFDTYFTIDRFYFYKTFFYKNRIRFVSHDLKSDDIISIYKTSLLRIPKFISKYFKNRMINLYEYRIFSYKHDFVEKLTIEQVNKKYNNILISDKEKKRLTRLNKLNSI